ncbi:bifunctional ADP-dependent NAD(P)H-hydrate dehydratase/NAD(P)H-hydrate epimerase [Bowmanella denitrificans]|uniref:Bifunctional NAD(P)H-hydrate repair enzyme n=1 Tax=Bowmanella denitrificans TaxID=366582 RepID=A0ABN0XV66_9ALTE
MPASLAYKAFTAEQVHQHEVTAAKHVGISMYELMERAGAAAFVTLQSEFPQARRILVLSGHGNNGGDGFVLARMAKKAGLKVCLVSLGDQSKFSPDTLQACNNWQQAGGEISCWPQPLADFDLIVDAMLGTGTKGQLREPYASVIKVLKNTDIPVLSLDVPSGLLADSGAEAGIALTATHTLTFVGIKPGLVTGQGKQFSGKLSFADLGIAESFGALATPSAHIVDFTQLSPLPARPLNSHKGAFGRLLCLGGNLGMPGAIRLTGEAALRTGAGLVNVLCHPDNQMLVGLGRPELMLAQQNQLTALLDWASCLVLGPGLGQDDWAQQLFDAVLTYQQTSHKPLLLDADALNLLAKVPRKLSCNVVITPHPGEAGRLLSITTQQVQADRYAALQQLQQQYQCHVVLKGAGSLVSGQDHCYVISNGNPGMAIPGMGDLLSGVIGALMAQGMDSAAAAVYGASLHAAAGDLAAQQHGERGMMASDLLPFIRKLVNR